MRYHHEPEKAVQCKELVHIIFLADLLISRFHVGLEMERMDIDNLAERLDTLGFSLQSLPDLIDMIPIEALRSLLQVVLLNE